MAFAVATPLALARAEPPAPPVTDRRWPARHLGTVLVSYGLFGAGYIAYMTFIVAFLKGHGTGPSGITAFWVVLGAASIAGAFAWARPIARLRGGSGPAMVLAVLGTGALLPLVSGSPEAAIGSALLFGGSFLSVVTAVTAVARRSPPHGAVRAMSSSLASRRARQRKLQIWDPRRSVRWNRLTLPTGSIWR